MDHAGERGRVREGADGGGLSRDRGEGVRGYRGIELFRRAAGDEVEFMTIMGFDSLDAVLEFAGEDYETAYVPPAARAVLASHDERSRVPLEERIEALPLPGPVFIHERHCDPPRPWQKRARDPA